MKSDLNGLSAHGLRSLDEGVRRLMSRPWRFWIAAGIGFVLVAGSGVPGQAGTVRQLTDQRATRIGSWGQAGTASYAPVATCLDDAGSTVYVNSSTNQLGGNPDHLFQIFKFDAATGAGQQITTFTKGVSDQPETLSVSDDGQWLAFVSKSDPVGQNHDASAEI